MSQPNLKDYRLADTIAAVATPVSKSALGVVKLSGTKSLAILDKIFIPKNKKKIKKQKSFTLHYGWIARQNKGLKSKGCQGREAIDEVLVSLMKAPRSYTAEDVVEISSHGGVVVLNQILESVLKEGARLANPGEFSYRAFVNGRIDLLQAESILGLVEAKTDKAASFSFQQLNGQNSKKFTEIKNELKDIFVYSESMINFPEEDISLSKRDIKERINRLIKKVDKLKKGQAQAKLLSQGLRCVICGRANSGKSTLFNRLLNTERVIVSNIPGTTRDVVEETIDIKGVPVKIYDTAGILEPKDFVTEKALEKTNQMFDQADLVVLLFDGSRKMNKDDRFFLNKTKNKNTILVVNKSDLNQKLSIDEKVKKNHKFIKMSALRDKDIDRFEKIIKAAVCANESEVKDLIFLNQYQKKELDNLARGLSEVKRYIDKKYTVDFINFSLKDCLDYIGKITGEVYCEEILESVFSNFCIGK